jgi:hypothetical protein
MGRDNVEFDRRLLFEMLGNHDTVAGRIAFETADYAKGLRTALEELGDRVDYIGNWWVEGNPYKAIHVVIVTGNAKHELQIHTAESMDAQQQTHASYKIYNNSGRPLAERIEAFDHSVAVFGRVPTPAGISKIGEPVIVTRPGEEAAERDIGAEVHEEIDKLVRMLAEKAGVEVSYQTVTLPSDLREAIDRGNEAYARGDLRAAFEAFRLAETRYLPDLGNQSGIVRRAVAEAMLGQGVILFENDQAEDAITTFTHAEELAEIAHDAKRAARAREYRRRAMLYREISAKQDGGS